MQRKKKVALSLIIIRQPPLTTSKQKTFMLLKSELRHPFLHLTSSVLPRYKTTPEGRTETHKGSFVPYKQLHGIDGDHECFRMTKTFILCDLL